MQDKQFHYTYSAPTEEERKEIESIRKQYAPEQRTESKLQRLRRLDTKVKRTPTVAALVFGIVGTLVFGLGLTMVLEWNLWLWGILCAVFGGALAAIAYPIHAYLFQRYKRRYGTEILKLSEEILCEGKSDSPIDR